MDFCVCIYFYFLIIEIFELPSHYKISRLISHGANPWSRTFNSTFSMFSEHQLCSLVFRNPSWNIFDTYESLNPLQFVQLWTFFNWLTGVWSSQALEWWRMKARNFITNFTAPFGKSDTYYMSTYHSKPPLSKGIGPISMQSTFFKQPQI